MDSVAIFSFTPFRFKSRGSLDHMQFSLLPCVVKTIQVSQFKAKCLGLLKEIRETGEPLTITLRGQTLAVVQGPGSLLSNQKESVAATLARLHPLLLTEEEDFEIPARRDRESARQPLGED